MGEKLEQARAGGKLLAHSRSRPKKEIAARPKWSPPTRATFSLSLHPRAWALEDIVSPLLCTCLIWWIDEILLEKSDHIPDAGPAIYDGTVLAGSWHQSA